MEDIKVLTTECVATFPPEEEEKDFNPTEYVEENESKEKSLPNETQSFKLDFGFIHASNP